MNGLPNSSQRADLRRRAVTLFFLWSSVAFAVETVTPCALALTQAGEKASAGTITFEERVAYQYAIEEVYWRHRIWPKENPSPKPSLDQVMSRADIEKKVQEYLRNSQALEDYWQRPITAERLQAEMDRMPQ